MSGRVGTENSGGEPGAVHRHACIGVLAAAAISLLSASCGGRSAIDRPEPAPTSDAGALRAERCNGLDDDGDGNVDESFRDELGRYVDDAHCGACGRRCTSPIDHAQVTGCGLVEEAATCVAFECEPGYGLTRAGQCSERDAYLCLPCVRDEDCGPLASARCANIDGQARCSRGCEDGCPEDYVCVGGQHCAPRGQSCACPAGDTFSYACELPLGCVGRARCEAGVATECVAPPELCGGGDEDCDGVIDEGFVDARGAYSLDLRHCGACGRDCTLDQADLPLTCGGDPFAPSCIVDCPDARDGIQVGDLLDADGDLQNGCECRVRALQDTAGASEAGQDVDLNCDGAVGNVLGSLYVATTGDDSGPGSPTRPLATIDEAIRRAHASRDTPNERLDVFVAGGVYTETLHLRDGVRVHGGYRTDFRARSVSGYEVIVIAPAEPAEGELPGGAALLAMDAGFAPTLIEGMELRGRDARTPGEPAIGAALIRPGPNLVLRTLRVQSGRPGAGSSGRDGAAGGAPQSAPTGGAAPRASTENAERQCVALGNNSARGGIGGRNTCGGSDVSGGGGGTARCPLFAAQAESGDSGRGARGASGGPGGAGGVDLRGPIVGGTSCPSGVCCGLADFSVPGSSFLASPGSAGVDGLPGSAGAACTDPLGAFDRDGRWTPGRAFVGTSGSPGGGGGGGGAGGGAVIDWFDTLCEFPDGIGGGGGGGGAGGCGGAAGQSGNAGAPAIAVLIRLGVRGHLPTLEDNQLITAAGGDGGHGGSGGDGGPGGSGAAGGRLLDAERTIPPLAGPSGGARGGNGGNGGPGGGGGGGCGGSSIGIWVVRDANAPVDSAKLMGNAVTLGAQGAPGRGGGGPLRAADGARGESHALLIR